MSSQEHSGSGSSSSLRRQPTLPPTTGAAVSSSSSAYRLHEASLFSTAPSLYAYPASTALASVSQAVDKLHAAAASSSSGRHAQVSAAAAAAGPFSASLSLLQKNNSLGLMAQGAAQYQQQAQQAQQAQAYSRSSAAHGSYHLNQRKLNHQYPYL